MENVVKLILSFAFIILVSYLGYLVYEQANSEEYQRLSAALQEVEEGNARLREENTQLYHRIEALREDPRAIERKVRDELNLIRSDEVLILLNQEKK